MRGKSFRKKGQFSTGDAVLPPQRSAKGHGPALLSTEASSRCRFSQATFAGADGNGRDAPIADVA